MARTPPQPSDPSKIDVSLEIVGEGGQAAIENLAVQIAALTQHLAAVNDPSGAVPPPPTPPYARGTVVSRTTTGPSVSRPADPAELISQHASDARGILARMRGYAAGDTGLGGIVDAELARYARTEEEQAARRPPGDYHHESIHAGSLYDEGRGRGGIPSSNASNPSDPIWLRALKSDPEAWERSQEGFKLPQFGELTIQDKLLMASDMFGRSATRAHTRGQARAIQEGLSLGFSEQEMIAALTQGESVDEGGLRGRTAGLLRIGAEQSAQVVTIANEARRIANWGGGIQQAGVEAGYARAGQITIPGTDIGVTNPFDFASGDSAFREGLNQRINIQRLRAKGGINKEQASEIVQSLAGLGWTGEMGQDVAFDVMAPLVQKGLNPGLTAQMWDQTARNGTTTMEEFVDIMEDLPAAARAARLSLTAYQEGLLEFTETAKELGATTSQGLKLGTTLTTSFGIAPAQAGAALQSPMVSAIAMRQFGVLPNELGAVNPLAVAGIMNQSVDMALKLSAPFRRARKDADGNVAVPPGVAQDIQAARIMGVDINQFKKMKAAQDIFPAALKAQGAIEDLEMAERGRKAVKSQRAPFRQGGRGAPSQSTTYRPEDQDDIANINRYADESWSTVEAQLKQIAPEDEGERKEFLKEIKDIGKGDKGERAERARALLSERQQAITDELSNEQTVKVKFTAAAAKWFEQEGKTLPKELRDGNKGGTPRTGYSKDGTDWRELINSMGAG